MATTMLPPSDLLPAVLPTERLGAKGVARPDLRARYRKIPDARNGVTVVAALLQTIGVVIAAGVVNTWWSYLGAFLLMGRGHCQLNILGHESAHRLLFSRKAWNDQIGRWLLGYPALQGTLSYRRAHMAHHRDEMGPEEPDAGLYAGYPIPSDSLRRKLTRDLFFISGWKNLRALAYAAAKAEPSPGRTEARQVIAVQVVLFAAALGVGPAAAVPRVLARLLDEPVEGVQPSPGHRRARRDGPQRRPPPHHPPRPAAAAGPVPSRALQHRLAPGPPRRHRSPVPEPSRLPRRAGPFRLGRAGPGVPELLGPVAQARLRRTA